MLAMASVDVEGSARAANLFPGKSLWEGLAKEPKTERRKMCKEINFCEMRIFARFVLDFR